MGKIKEKTKKLKVFQTTDGKEFTKKKVAKRHQNILDGKIKLCKTCYGSGINPYYSSHVSGSEERSPTCNGTGER